MEEDARKCAWCGKEFYPLDGRQKYCSVECREHAHVFNRLPKPPKKKGTNPTYVCSREDCKIYNKKLANHCNGLIEVLPDTMKCSFYKEKR